MGASGISVQLALVFLLASATAREASAGLCPRLPLTGCTQSSNVILTASPQAPGSWTWTADDVDYGAAGPTGPPQASPGWEQNYVLCVYDGSAAITNDFITPVSPQMGGVLLYDSSDYSGITLTSSSAGSVTARFTGFSVADNKKLTTISQLISKNQLSKSCWAKAVSLKLPTDPSVPAVSDINLDPAHGLQLLNLLAARYNAAAQGGPLNLVTWLAGIAPTQILSNLAGVAAVDLLRALSALHIAGFWGGAWFQRDGFSGSVPPLGSAPAAAYGLAVSAPLLSTPGFANFLLYLAGDFAAAGQFGYNVGYSQLILTKGTEKGGAFVPPANVGLSCNLAKLFDCAITPNTIKQLDQLKDEFNKWSAVLPQTPNAVATAVELQQAQAQAGQGVWGNGIPGQLPPLVTFLKDDATVWQSVYQVNNLFLEALQLGGRLLLRGLALSLKKDPTVTTAAAAAALKDGVQVQTATLAWLSSYGVGLNVGAPGIGYTPPQLPAFDMGTTPVE